MNAVAEISWICLVKELIERSRVLEAFTEVQDNYTGAWSRLVATLQQNNRLTLQIEANSFLAEWLFPRIAG